MNCAEVRPWLDAYCDRELDLATSILVEKHLEGCTACKHIYAGRESLQAALQRPELHYTAPTTLREKLAAKLRETAGASENEKKVEVLPQPVSALPPLKAQQTAWVPWMAVAAVVLLAFAFTIVSRGHQRQELLAQAIVEAHVRSLQPNHLTDVISSDQHTVKPWFTGKIDFSPVVVDLASDGFPLTGGRLDYVEGHNAAALVYQRRKHTINVFVWPGDAPMLRKRFSSQGYNILLWRDAGLNYCAVSDVNADDLKELSEKMRAAH